MIFECKILILKNFNAFTSEYACFSKVLYFNSESLRVLLKKAIGFSSPSAFFYNRTAAIVSCDAKEKVRKTLEKSGLTNISD